MPDMGLYRRPEAMDLDHGLSGPPVLVNGASCRRGEHLQRRLPMTVLRLWWHGSACARAAVRQGAGAGHAGAVGRGRPVPSRLRLRCPERVAQPGGPQPSGDQLVRGSVCRPACRCRPAHHRPARSKLSSHWSSPGLPRSGSTYGSCLSSGCISCRQLTDGGQSRRPTSRPTAGSGRKLAGSVVRPGHPASCSPPLTLSRRCAA